MSTNRKMSTTRKPRRKVQRKGHSALPAYVSRLTPTRCCYVHIAIVANDKANRSTSYHTSSLCYFCNASFSAHGPFIARMHFQDGYGDEICPTCMISDSSRLVHYLAASARYAHTRLSGIMAKMTPDGQVVPDKSGEGIDDADAECSNLNRILLAMSNGIGLRTENLISYLHYNFGADSNVTAMVYDMLQEAAAADRGLIKKFGPMPQSVTP